jgi:hypothetical protein
VRIREDQTRLHGVADGPYDRRDQCNAGGGRGPWFRVNARSGEDSGDWINDPGTSGTGDRTRSSRIMCGIFSLRSESSGSQ